MSLHDQLLRMEYALADPQVRQNMDVMDTIIHADFMEIGASGRVFNKASIMDMMETEQNYPAYEVTDFNVIALGEDQALVTFSIPARKSEDEVKPGSLRSSLWVKAGDTWQIRFHQGTRCP